MTKAYAHSGTKPDRSDWQTLGEHRANVAALAALRGAELGLTEAARLTGAFHDFGKHDRGRPLPPDRHQPDRGRVRPEISASLARRGRVGLCDPGRGPGEPRGQAAPADQHPDRLCSPQPRPPSEVAALARAMQATAAKIGPEALLTPEAIRDGFSEVYWRAGEALLDKEAILSKFSAAPSGVDFAYRSVAEAYRMVDRPLLPVIIPTAQSERAIAQLSAEALSSGRIARDLQPYTVQIPARAREILRQNGKGAFHAQLLRGDQFFVLTDASLYRQDLGLWWEGPDELSEAQSMV